MPGSQDYFEDPRNTHALIYLNGAMVPRDQAKVSIFDAGFVLGDGIWEGIRLHHGQFLFLDAHLDRLFRGARAISLDIGLSSDEVRDALRRTVDANSMDSGVHIRIMVTRGVKKTPNQDPRNALGQPTIVIVAEYKEPNASLVTQGLKLHTTSIRCTPREMFDMRLNSHSRLNLIIALLEAIKAGADEALMLDPHGFVSSCNATNCFWVRAGTVYTSAGEYCFNGITRQNVILLCRQASIPIQLGDFTLDDLHAADEAFVTGTFGGVTPVSKIDAHDLPAKLPGPVTQRLRQLYAYLKDSDASAATNSGDRV